MVFGNAQRRRLLLPCMVLGLLLVILSQRRLIHRKLRHKAKLQAIQAIHEAPDTALVVAKSPHESADWALGLFPSWHPYIYSTSDPPEPRYLSPAHPGDSEVPSYLSFIIEHYDALPNHTAFVHTRRQQHQPAFSSLASSVLQNLHLESISTRGFANLHCTHDPSCPTVDTEAQDLSTTLFGTSPPPSIRSTPTTQFIVTRRQIQTRPKADYERLLEWIQHANGPNPDGVSSALAQLWHVIFGMAADDCPSFDECQCRLIGSCGRGVQDTAGREGRHFVPLVRGAIPSLGRWRRKWHDR